METVVQERIFFDFSRNIRFAVFPVARIGSSRCEYCDQEATHRLALLCDSETLVEIYCCHGCYLRIEAITGQLKREISQMNLWEPLKGEPSVFLKEQFKGTLERLAQLPPPPGWNWEKDLAEFLASVEPDETRWEAEL